MRIGILVLSIGNFGQKGFYNTQEIGLAKAMDSLFDEIKVYKLVAMNQKQSVETIEGCKHSTIVCVPAKSIGNNGIIGTKVLDPTLDALVCFSDTQFYLPKVFRWAQKNQVKLLPYIGVIESHSNNKLKKILVDFMFGRNIRVYKKCHCLVKTPNVKENLEKLGVKKISVTPVGLDLSLLQSDYMNFDVFHLKQKYGYSNDDKVLLFVGRLIEEKQPLRMISIFNSIAKNDEQYKLLMVGNGELKEQVNEQIAKYDLAHKVKLIEKIPNKDIWELYRFADTFVNLNQQEIFGMAILEAMYYGCKVVAWEAPGPSFIIEDGMSGWLVSSEEQAIEKIKDNIDVIKNAHKRICEKFTWSSTAEKILEVTNKL